MSDFFFHALKMVLAFRKLDFLRVLLFLKENLCSKPSIILQIGVFFFKYWPCLVS